MENLSEHGAPTAGSTHQLKVEDKAFGPVQAFCAEYLSAVSFAEAGDRVVLHGGKTRMYDIATAPFFTDIKTLMPMKPHEREEARREFGYEADWKLFVPSSGEFPTANQSGSARRTHLGLVRLVADYSATWTGRKLVIEAKPAQFVCSWIPTEDVNARIDDSGAVWYVPKNWLESYPTFELRELATGNATADRVDDLL
ncbi:hypothetical protein OG948_60070 (plasmid) [Embleya sp. NBC_00888]|uniref:hypothetical protein n=1 Tax=Embleya sp. NBC_00888 TaxID=2975960 RepID=UPI002F90E624|nr:hypothetical protein OG948_60070 [Embleya sp. NBC_00888]